MKPQAVPLQVGVPPVVVGHAVHEDPQVAMLVLLAHVEVWDPPVPMDTVLSQLDPSENAKGDFEAGVVRITAHEYETALAVAAARAPFAG